MSAVKTVKNNASRLSVCSFYFLTLPVSVLKKLTQSGIIGFYLINQS